MMLTANTLSGESGPITPAACAGSLALDIGPSRGALIIYPDERFRGREIEISRHGGHGHRVHTGVHERRSGARSLLTAVFGSLPAGDYTVWADGHTPAGTAQVAEAAVAEFRLD
jgi:hypothetical protein